MACHLPWRAGGVKHLPVRYGERLKKRISETGSGLCVGLDPRPEQTEGGAAGVLEFLRRVVGETAPYAAAFKPNIAYFEAMGLFGWELLEELLAEMKGEVPIVLDVKRGDIGETQGYYAQAYFERMGVDAVTLSPFMGYDTLEPFLDWEGKGIYLLAVTSNAGSQDLQRRSCEGRRVFERVGDFASTAMEEGRKTDVGLVVGLTNAEDEVMAKIPDVPLLIPGLGAQGGSLSALRGRGLEAPNLVNVSRGILYSEPEKTFSEKARLWAGKIAEELSV